MMAPHAVASMRNSLGGTCALGAARDAGYPIVESAHGYAVEDGRFPAVQCPACFARGMVMGPWSLYRVITHLNDLHRWTREKIAEWVESVEPHEESTPLAAVDPRVDIRERLATRAEKVSV